MKFSFCRAVIVVKSPIKFININVNIADNTQLNLIILHGDTFLYARVVLFLFMGGVVFFNVLMADDCLVLVTKGSHC